MKKLRRAILPAFLFLCLILGGASAGGYLANLALQLIAVGLICWAMLSSEPAPLSQQQKILIGFMLTGCLVVAVQLVPLPLSLWKELPMRGAIAEADSAAGITPSPAFLTLMPHETIKSAVWMLPALGLAIAMLRTRARHARHMAWAILAVMALSVLLGALQLTRGGNSPWYLYRNTNRGSTVGFFANSNHLATLLLVSIPFLAALVRQSWPRDPGRRGVIVTLAASILSLALVGIFVNASLAGWGMAAPVLVASAMILAPDGKLQRFALPLLALVVLAGAVLVLATEEGQSMLAAGGTLSASARETIFATSWTAIADFMPTGSGLGSFAEIYRLYEDPATVGPRYVNHAHNDYLELLLETGAPGALLLGVFLIWWGWRSVRVWRAENAGPFARAAVIVTATILIHSLVDYPLRTAAIGSIFALCCVLMAGWVNGDQLLLNRRRDWASRKPTPETA